MWVPSFVKGYQFTCGFCSGLVTLVIGGILGGGGRGGGGFFFPPNISDVERERGTD